MKPVRYTDRAYSKIQQWVQLCPKEISGYGTVKIVDDHFVVTDAFLLEQEVTSVTTEIDALATAHLMDELSDREEELGELRLWWHSHVDMDVFWSATDEEAIRTIRGNPYLVSSVFNKKGEVRTRVDSFSTPYQLKQDNIEIEIVPDGLTSITSVIDLIKKFNDLPRDEVKKEVIRMLDIAFDTLGHCEAEYKKKVVVKKPAVRKVTAGKHGRLHSRRNRRNKRSSSKKKEVTLQDFDWIMSAEIETEFDESISIQEDIVASIVKDIEDEGGTSNGNLSKRIEFIKDMASWAEGGYQEDVCLEGVGLSKFDITVRNRRRWELVMDACTLVDVDLADIETANEEPPHYYWDAYLSDDFYMSNSWIYE